MDTDLISFEESITFKPNIIAKVLHWCFDIFFTKVTKNLTRYIMFVNSTPYIDESMISTVFYQLPLELMFNYNSDILLDPEITIVCFLDKLGHEPVLLSDCQIYTLKGEELTEYELNKDCSKCLLFVLPEPFSDTIIPRTSVLVSTGELPEKIIKYFEKKVKSNNSDKYEEFTKNAVALYEQSKLTKIRYLERKLFRYYVLPTKTKPVLNIDLFIFGNPKLCREYIINLLIVYIGEIKEYVNSPRLNEILFKNINLMKQPEYSDIPTYLLIYYETTEITDSWKDTIIKDCDSIISELKKYKLDLNVAEN